MTNCNYTSEKNTQILIALMKAHNIKKIVASPGTTNVCLVGSLQSDPYFEIYSSVDERSAAYLACGMAAESGEPVVLSCTGATASRNYAPGLTEAFYRKLPILAITSTQHSGRIGQNFPQVIDRTAQFNDLVKKSIQVPTVFSDEDEWATGVKINDALLELRRRGGGPVHINLETSYSRDFSVKNLPDVKVIRRFNEGDNVPEIKNKKVAIYVGNHDKWNDSLTEAVDEFCEKYNSLVLCDQTSKYTGKYRIMPNLVCWQEQYTSQNRFVDVLIDIGNVSGAYVNINAKEVWRINEDGEIRDSFKKLTHIFEMPEVSFFKQYNKMTDTNGETSYYEAFKKEYDSFVTEIKELPFSNIWIAQESKNKLPKNSVVHYGILNSLRSWNFVEVDKTILGYSNTGGFGIDGNTSSLIGASIASPQKLFFGFVGDLSFFYDMNSIGNRHVGNNIRLMIINNGKGTEFRNYNHPAAKFGEDADQFMAAAGHYGQKSIDLIKHYSTDLGFKYLSAHNKEEFIECAKEFFNSDVQSQPIVFEVFTDSKDESDALYIMNNLKSNATGNAKNIARSILGDKGVQAIKKVIGR